ncbi:hypothetical protein UU7_17279 [Rhodanobacter spathiphylli B39]|uniref:Uncharacterized protein n=1 Tax=Rhodanobacter spathiphylli B39 TaxID=1163407 RepID=I4VJB1_9GAMM|nr:hypothetical protein UU7_17279 [Rhodanobacter spathiphylli B39]
MYANCDLFLVQFASTSKGHNRVDVNFVIVHDYFFYVCLDDAFLLFRAFASYISIFLKVFPYHIFGRRMCFGLQFGFF